MTDQRKTYAPPREAVKAANKAMCDMLRECSLIPEHHSGRDCETATRVALAAAAPAMFRPLVDALRASKVYDMLDWQDHNDAIDAAIRGAGFDPETGQPEGN